MLYCRGNQIEFILGVIINIKYMENKTRLVSTTELMRILDVKSYNTIQRFQDAGIISPVKIGRNKKWDIQSCLNTLKNGKK